MSINLLVSYLKMVTWCPADLTRRFKCQLSRCFLSSITHQQLLVDGNDLFLELRNFGVLFRIYNLSHRRWHFLKALSKLKAQISNLERLFSLKPGKRDVQDLNFDLWVKPHSKMPQGCGAWVKPHSKMPQGCGACNSPWQILKICWLEPARAFESILFFLFLCV